MPSFARSFAIDVLGEWEHVNFNGDTGAHVHGLACNP